MAWIKREFLLPSGLSDTQAKLIGEELLDYIVERSKEGKGKDGKAFPGYSKSYKNSFDFKAAGKSSKVNLTLSGEMLDALQLLSANKKKIVIGFEKGSDINGRAEGNILGTYGTDTPNSKKARDFLDISRRELSSIVNEIDSLPEDIQEEISKLAREGAIEIIDSSTFDFEEDE